MLVWLIVPFYDIFAVFHPSPLTVCINCSFFEYVNFIISYCSHIWYWHLESQHKWSTAPSVASPAVDEERMATGWGPFNALALMVK